MFVIKELVGNNIWNEKFRNHPQLYNNNYVNILVHLVTNISSVHVMLYAHFKNINPTVIYKISFYARSYIEFILVLLNILSHHSLPWLHHDLFS